MLREGYMVKAPDVAKHLHNFKVLAVCHVLSANSVFLYTYVYCVSIIYSASLCVTSTARR